MGANPLFVRLGILLQFDEVRLTFPKAAPISISSELSDVQRTSVTRKRRILPDDAFRGTPEICVPAMTAAQLAALIAATSSRRASSCSSRCLPGICGRLWICVWSSRLATCSFLWNVRYFTDFLGQPGSLLEWTDNLLVQLCYWGWPGAIAVAAAAWLLLVSTIGLMNALGRASIGGTWVIPGLLLVMLYSSYLFPTSAVVGLALAMTAANVWCRMPAWRPWRRVCRSLSRFRPCLYYVVGEAYYCFAACCAIHEALARRRRLSGVLFLLAAVGVKFGLDAVLAQSQPGVAQFSRAVSRQATGRSAELARDRSLPLLSRMCAVCGLSAAGLRSGKSAVAATSEVPQADASAGSGQRARIRIARTLAAVIAAPSRDSSHAVAPLGGRHRLGVVAGRNGRVLFLGSSAQDAQGDRLLRRASTVG